MSAERALRRGDVVLVDFNPAQPHEASDTRPAVVVTNDVANRHGITICVVPLTTNTERVYPFQVLLEAERTGLNRDSKAQIEQLRSVGLARVGRRVGRVPEELMRQLDARLRLHLAL